MFVFLLSQLPLPIIVFLNVRVTLRFLRVRRLSRRAAVKKPARLMVGWWLNNLAAIFVVTPSIVEHRIFVQDYKWFFSYATAATLTIIGLLLMNSALGQELRQLTNSPKKTATSK